MHFVGRTDTGRRRKHNEDTFAVSDEHQYGVLADGMGGRDHGEVASRMVVDHLVERIETLLDRRRRRLEREDAFAVTTNLLDEWIREASAAIYARSQEDAYSEMGTTLVALVVRDHHAILAHVGDSRCYLWRRGEGLRLMTDDHSLVNSQVKTGMISVEEAQNSSQRNIITRAVGTGPAVKPDIAIFPLQPRDRLLICSDGIHDMIDDEKIEMMLSRQASPDDICEGLVDAANAAGGRDNITVLIAEGTPS